MKVVNKYAKASAATRPKATSATAPRKIQIYRAPRAMLRLRSVQCMFLSYGSPHNSVPCLSAGSDVRQTEYAAISQRIPFEVHKGALSRRGCPSSAKVNMNHIV